LVRQQGPQGPSGQRVQALAQALARFAQQGREQEPLRVLQALESPDGLWHVEQYASLQVQLLAQHAARLGQHHQQRQR
jgi:hypothetical protein